MRSTTSPVTWTSTSSRWRVLRRTTKRASTRSSAGANRSSGGGRPGRLLFLSRDRVLADPVQQDVGDIEAVVVLHQHVRVALDADLRQHQQLRSAAGGVGGGDKGASIFQPRRPARKLVDVVAEQHQDRQARIRLQIIYR